MTIINDLYLRKNKHPIILFILFYFCYIYLYLHSFCSITKTITDISLFSFYQYILNSLVDSLIENVKEKIQ